jgi:hypothetical protein
MQASARDDGRRKRPHPSQPYPRPYGLKPLFKPTGTFRDVLCCQFDTQKCSERPEAARPHSKKKTLTFVLAQVTKNRNHDKIVAPEKEKAMRVTSERQDASDGTGITCLNNSLNTRHVG